MKKMKKNLIITYILTTFGFAFILTGCEENDELKVYTYPEQTVGDFSPTSGSPGHEVIINGSDFGDYQGAVTVFFNGVATTEDQIVSVADDKIVVQVPEEASTGTISVKVWTYTKEATGVFTFIPGPKITSLSANSGAKDDEITINGTNFGTDLNNVSVLFNGTSAEVVSVTDTSVNVIVPANGETGVVKLSVGSIIATGPVFTYLTSYGINYGFNTDGNNEGWQNSWGGTSAISTNGGYLSSTVSNTSTTGSLMNTAMPIYPDSEPYLAVKIDELPNKPGFIAALYNDGSMDGVAGDYSLPDYTIINDNIYVFSLERSELSSSGAFNVYMYLKFEGLLGGDVVKVDWIRTYASISDIMEDNLQPEGKYFFEFDDPTQTGDWTASQNSTVAIEDGKLKVTFDPTQFAGTNKRRADLYNVILGKFPYPSGADKASWVYTPEYPIIAMKITFNETGDYKPGTGNIKLDPYTGSNNSYITDFAGKNVIYYDVSDKYTERTELNVWQFKIADITSAETGYQVDWVRTFKSKEDLSAFLN